MQNLPLLLTFSANTWFSLWKLPSDWGAKCLHCPFSTHSLLPPFKLAIRTLQRPWLPVSGSALSPALPSSHISLLCYSSHKGHGDSHPDCWPQWLPSPHCLAVLQKPAF